MAGLAARINGGFFVDVEGARELVDRLKFHGVISPSLTKASRMIWTKCIVLIGWPALADKPPMCIMQLISPEVRICGWAALTCSSFNLPIASEMMGNATENVPPKPQHCSPSPKGTRVRPRIDERSLLVASLLSVPRE